ncbi:unnamed protein product [Mytilus edulis]|uniref:Uncharacterized protein n=1 Tax=Mytilus edulis TaxID=6550 RepID=A0A8S3UHE4_MYTED|nr:unnamed protein product [Mytilus edulis]
MAGIEDLESQAEAEIIKGKVNLIIHEFSHIAYSGCKETLEEEGLKPSIIKRIFKTWNFKARVFHESNMLGETMRDSFETFLQNPDINLTPSYIRDLVKGRENAAKRRGETYLSLLKNHCSIQKYIENQVILNRPQKRKIDSEDNEHVEVENNVLIQELKHIRKYKEFLEQKVIHIQEEIDRKKKIRMMK